MPTNPFEFFDIRIEAKIKNARSERPIHIPILSMCDIVCQDSSPAFVAKRIRVNAKPSRPFKLINDKNVARCAVGTFGAIAALSGAEDKALGQLRSNVAIAAGILMKKCIMAIIAI